MKRQFYDRACHTSADFPTFFAFFAPGGALSLLFLSLHLSHVLFLLLLLWWSTSYRAAKKSFYFPLSHPRSIHFVKERGEENTKEREKLNQRCGLRTAPSRSRKVAQLHLKREREREKVVSRFIRARCIRATNSFSSPHHTRPHSIVVPPPACTYFSTVALARTNPFTSFLLHLKFLVTQKGEEERGMPIKFSTLPVPPSFAPNEWEFLSFRSLEGRLLEAVEEGGNRTMGRVVAALLPLLLLSKRRVFCPSGEEETRFLSFTIFPPKVVSRDKRDTHIHTQEKR